MKKLTFLLLLVPLLLSGCSASATDGTSKTKSDDISVTAKSVTAKSQKGSKTKPSNDSSSNDLKDMSNWTYQSGEEPVKVLNNNQPTTIKANDFSKAHIDYSSLDKLNRTGTATAYLTRANLGKSKTRTEQVWKPTGWHNEPININGSRVIPQNRGHLIAYTLTFNLNDDGQEQQGHLGSINNPYNLFTQTAFSNQKTMTETEQMVRNALARNKKVIYQVTPIFRGNELMARGAWVQAISTDGSMKFNRYLWNVQGNIQYDYATGRSRIDNDFKVPGDDGKTQTVSGNQRYRNHSNRKYHNYHHGSNGYHHFKKHY